MELRARRSGVRTTRVSPYYIATGMFEGVRTRFALLLPILAPEYVAAKIVRAVRRRQPVLCMPRVVYWVPLLRALVPVSVSDLALEILGISSSMDHFKQTR